MDQPVEVERGGVGQWDAKGYHWVKKRGIRNEKKNEEEKSGTPRKGMGETEKTKQSWWKKKRIFLRARKQKKK